MVGGRFAQCARADGIPAARDHHDALAPIERRTILLDGRQHGAASRLYEDTKLIREGEARSNGVLI